MKLSGFLRRPARAASSRGAVLLGLLCVASLCMAASPASAEAVRIRYSVKMIGLPLGSAGLKGSVNGAGYQVAVDAKLTGIAAFVSSSQGAATATGALAQGRLTPATYANSSSNSKETRTVRMAMTGGAVKGVDISPPVEDGPGRIAVTDAHKRNIVDPLSALIMPVAGTEPLVGPAACNRTLPIFDGFTRFDVSLSYVGTRQVKTQGYSGPVSVCSARYTPIAGHRPDRKQTQFMANNRQMEVWLAPLPNARVVVPYRISVATMIGTTVIEASEFTVDKSDAAVMISQ
jgi:hypothetical protein